MPPFVAPGRGLEFRVREAVETIDGGASVSDELDVDDHELFVGPVLLPVVALLARAHLQAALPRRLRRAIGRKDPVVVVVETTSESWTNRIAAAAGDMFRANAITATKPPGKSPVQPALAEPRPTFAISQNLDWLPRTLVSNADHIARIRSDHRLVEGVISQVCGRRARVMPSDIAGLDLPDFSFAIRPGSAYACVKRLKRASARSAGAVDDRTPRLEDLVGYGASRDQMLAISEDLSRVREGKLDPSALPSVLLFGAPGTGKTLLVKALAKSAGAPFVATSVASWFTSSDGYLGGVARSAQTFFDELVSLAPAIGFLDEIDALPDRSTLDARGRDWWNPVVTGVLLNIDRVRSMPVGVVLVAATNHPKHLDAALKRPGRFDRHVEIVPPRTAAELAGILRHHLREDLAGADLEPAALLGLGATGAMAEQWVKSARETARVRGGLTTMADLCAAIAPADERSPAELMGCALHEAAHAVAGHVMGYPATHVSVVRTDESLGFARFPAVGSLTRAKLEDQVVLILAGRAADELLGAGADSGAAHDLQVATRLVVGAHAVLGLRESLISRSLDSDPEAALTYNPMLARQVEEDLERLMERARDLVARNDGPIRQLAQCLVDNRIATPRDIDRVLAGSTVVSNLNDPGPPRHG